MKQPLLGKRHARNRSAPAVAAVAAFLALGCVALVGLKFSSSQRLLLFSALPHDSCTLVCSTVASIREWLLCVLRWFDITACRGVELLGNDPFLKSYMGADKAMLLGRTHKTDFWRSEVRAAPGAEH